MGHRHRWILYWGTATVGLYGILTCKGIIAVSMLYWKTFDLARISGRSGFRYTRQRITFLSQLARSFHNLLLYGCLSRSQEKITRYTLIQLYDACLSWQMIHLSGLYFPSVALLLSLRMYVWLRGSKESRIQYFFVLRALSQARHLTYMSTLHFFVLISECVGIFHTTLFSKDFS